MIAYKDFVPATEDAGGLIRSRKYASFDNAVTAANEWIRQSEIELLGVETVLLPEADTPSQTAQSGSGEVYRAVQVVRVWYRS